MSTAVKGTTHPAAAMRALTASASPLDPRPVSLLISVSGSIVIGNEDGTNSGTINVFAGQEIHCQPYKITTITSATVIGMFAD